MRTQAAKSMGVPALRACVVLLAGALLALPGARLALAGGVTIAAEDVTAASSGAVELTISGHSEQPIGALRIDVLFDEELLKAYSCQTTIGICKTGTQPGALRLNSVSLSGFSGDITFATIVFEAVGPDGSEARVDVIVSVLSDTIGNDMLDEVSVTDGSVTIGGQTPPTPPGDANCDSTLSAADGLAVISDLAGARDAGCFSLADVNCDGRVNAADALTILRSVGGLPLGLPAGCGAIA
ncbi:MAG TPA: dockerin type I domain-containing protein [Dehalococcoidia bacterium]